MSLTYSGYLNLDALLSLQVTRAPAGSDESVRLAERFFIVAHQCTELWVAQGIADIDGAIAALDPAGGGPGDPDAACELLQRADSVVRILHDHMLALERLPLGPFAEFRRSLGTASGAQSSGLPALERRLGGGRRAGTLYEAFAGAVERSGRPMAEICRTGSGPLHRFGETMLSLGDGYWRWKVAHLSVVTRMLGTQPGTGGSAGARYLVERIEMPFAEYRALRGQVHTESELIS